MSAYQAKLKSFVSKILLDAGVKPRNIELFTSPENMPRFEEAFTHFSYDPLNNYDVYEFFGDTCVNHIITRHMYDRFKQVKSEKWFTRIKHVLSSGKILGQIASNHGFYEMVRMNPEFKRTVIENVPDWNTKGKFYHKILEDVFEAFLGCLSLVIDDVSKTKGIEVGVGFEVCFNIGSTFLWQHDVDLSFESLFDPVTRLKETYEWILPNKPKWLSGNDKIYRDYELPNGEFKVEAIGWPEGNREPIRQNERVMGVGVDADRDEAQIKAAEQAYQEMKRLALLRPQPNIEEKTKKNWKVDDNWKLNKAKKRDKTPSRTRAFEPSFQPPPFQPPPFQPPPFQPRPPQTFSFGNYDRHYD